MSRQLPEEEKRLVRAGYYLKYNKGMRESLLNTLSEEQIAYYKSYKEPFRKKLKNILVGLLSFFLMIVIWTSPIWISMGWIWLFPGDDQDTQSVINGEDSNCNPNYSPCIPNTSYDLDCADIGKSVRVIGNDEYRLDRDKDGRGCESY